MPTSRLYVLLAAACAGCATQHPVETKTTFGSNPPVSIAVPMTTITPTNAPGGAARYAVEPQHTLAAFSRIEGGDYYNTTADTRRRPLDVDRLPPPKMTVTEKVQKSVVVHFKFNKHELSSEGMATIDAIARGMPEAIRVSVIGHADAKGTESYNKDLSKKRSEAVVAALEKAGIRREIISDQANGANAPIDENLSVTGRSYNRRVEVLIEGAEHPVETNKAPSAINARVLEAYQASIRNATRSELYKKAPSTTNVTGQHTTAAKGDIADEVNFSKGAIPVLTITPAPGAEAKAFGKPGVPAKTGQALGAPAKAGTKQHIHDHGGTNQ
jgi:outer membrane protein OmpA-like peptidoglycan-associated protein